MQIGGMWGFHNSRNRDLADRLYKKMINTELSKKYNKDKNKKLFDQYFLRDHVYSSMKNISVIHDSFMCKNFHDSEPWPTKRKGGCYVGGRHKSNCETEFEEGFRQCPVECRQKKHGDWIYC